MGAGLHVAADRLEGEAKISETATVLSVAIPVAIYAAAFYTLYSVLMRTRDPLHLVLLAGNVRRDRARGAAGGSGREHLGLPARADARPGHHGGRLRDDRPAARGGRRVKQL